MSFNLQLAQRKLRWLRFASYVTWFATAVLFLVPAYQWLVMGRVPLDMIFVALTTANIFLAVAATKITSRLKFARYQLRYFSENQEGVP